ncbi:MAG: efflux RND transporter periplasmic adaptor subunit [Acetobacteraceae bacterium]|nr:efflux RND transporter periplasmic adaptor subunit [Acetobacteraceae bacterium]
MDERVREIELEPTTARTAPGSRVRLPRPLLWLAALAVLGGLGVAIGLYPARQPAPAPIRSATQIAPAVRTVTARLGDLPIELVGLGTVTPVATVTVVPVLSGPLTEVAFQEGQFVKEGDFLAQIDPRPYQVQLEQHQAQLAKDQALLAQARMDLRRYQILNRQDSIARQQAEDQVYVVQQYEAAVKLDQAQIDNDKLNLVYAHITSPVTGLIGLRRVDPGNYVFTTSSTGIAVITQMQPITVVFVLPEDQVQDVLKRYKAGAVLPVTAYDRSDSHPLEEGMLYAIGSAIDNTTGTFNLRAIFPNKNNQLFPQQFVNAHLLLDTLHNVPLVPVSAVQTGAPGSYVYVMDKDHRVHLRPIKLGPQHGELVAVQSGLAPGEEVVTDGIDRLREGMKVRPVNGQSEPSAPPPHLERGSPAAARDAAPARAAQR